MSEAEDSQDRPDKDSGHASRIPVCLMVGSFQKGGAEEHVLQIIKNINQDRFVPLLAVMSDVGDLLPVFEKMGVSVCMIGKERASGLVRGYTRFKSVLRLRDFLKEHRAKVIHIHLVGCFMTGLIAGWLAGVGKRLISWHNIYDNSVRTWGSLTEIIGNIQSILRIFLGSFMADEIVAVSGMVAERNEAAFMVPHKKIHIVHNGITFPTPVREIPRPGKTLRVVSIGSLLVQKDQETMIRGVVAAASRGCDVELSIVGEGPERANLERLIDDLEGERCVSLMGLRSDVPQLLPEFDVFVMTSLWEGFSIALLEAMATGLPIIATAVGGNPEALDDHNTGILIPPRNVGAFADALCWMYRNSAERHQMGMRAQEAYVNRHTVQSMMKRLEDLYASGVGGQKIPSQLVGVG